jgi:hypothetical protein
VLKEQTVALTQWLDGSGSNQSTNIKQNVQTNFTQSTVQSCVNNLNGYNILNVSGTGNVVKDVTQKATLSVISQCLVQNSQTNSVISSITNTANQHAEYKAANPLSFLADTFNALAKSLAAAAVLGFILLICFVVLYVAYSKHSKKKKIAAQGMPSMQSMVSV